LWEVSKSEYHAASVGRWTSKFKLEVNPVDFPPTIGFPETVWYASCVKDSSMMVREIRSYSM